MVKTASPDFELDEGNSFPSGDDAAEVSNPNDVLDTELDWDSVEAASSEFPTLVPGDYNGIIEACAPHTSKEGNVSLKATCLFSDGDTEVRVWHYFGIGSDKAKSITKRDLLLICPERMQGFVPRRDAATLKGVRFRAKLKYVPAEGEYAASNKIAKFLGPATEDDSEAFE